MTEWLWHDAGPDLVCMVFCAETGNAVDSFDATPEEFHRAAARYGSHATIDPSPFLAVPWVQEELRV